MSIATKLKPKPKRKVLSDEAFAKLLANLPCRDGVPMDSDWQRLAMNFIIEVLRYYFSPRTDFYVGGNMFLYYSQEQVRNRDFLGPDTFFVWDVQEGDRPRLYWCAWEERFRLPNVIWELISPSTEKRDRTHKKDIYEKTIKTPEYFIYAPESQKLEGWRLVDHSYQVIEPNERGWLWCEQLQLWVGTWMGTYLGMKNTYIRFFEPNGRMCPLPSEASEQAAQEAKRKASREKKKAATERRQATLAKEQAEAEKQRAEAEKLHAESETQRADQAERELARLKVILSSTEKNKNGK